MREMAEALQKHTERKEVEKKPERKPERTSSITLKNSREDSQGWDSPDFIIIFFPLKKMTDKTPYFG